MNSLRRLRHSMLVAIALATLGCGGSGGGSLVANNGGGIGGSGISATGTVDGFGSIFVNGIEFETTSAVVTLDGASADETDLRLGMVVTVVGTVDTNGTTGTANTVEFDDDVQGPVSQIQTNADGTQKTLSILGISVLVDRITTTFEDTSFDLVAVNDLIEVSGFYDTNSILHATRIQRKEAFSAGSSEIEIKGQVSGLAGSQFTLGSYLVEFSGADLSGVPGGMLSDAMSVEVKGTLSAGTITATSIEQEDGLYGETADNVHLEGLVTDFVSNADFKVLGQSVDASLAQLTPASLQLSNGARVEVEGDIINGVLVAQSIEARSGEVSLAAPIQALNLANALGSVDLAYFSGVVSFEVTAKTELGDETNTYDPISWSDLSPNDFLEVKGLFDGISIVATEVRLSNGTQQLIQGPVESFVSGNSLRIFGLDYTTTGADFQDSADLTISATDFYTQLGAGDLVKVQDNDPADGIADEVEFEN